MAFDRVCLTDSICVNDVGFGEVTFAETLGGGTFGGTFGLAPSECSSPLFSPFVPKPLPTVSSLFVCLIDYGQGWSKFRIIL